MKLKVDVKQQQPAKVKPSRKNATAATRNKTDKRIAPPATGKRPGLKRYDSKQQQPAPPNVSEIRPGDGGRAFIKAFNQLVAAESLAIAKAVIAKVKLGDINGARFLDEIIGAKALRNQSPPKSRRSSIGMSVNHLTEQPEWQALSEPEVDTGFGGREPEN